MLLTIVSNYKNSCECSINENKRSISNKNQIGYIFFKQMFILFNFIIYFCLKTYYIWLQH
ncbi:MAG: hypothetical protein A2275_00350 [Bacteroidetes bacterium RIFOXYA12_FULL_35_11]|nr:MAG: hypothetical protein A2X01_16750 [Bacteroidetes bacterium GWF2_35_48]OFY81097.1 MAG: hypothetical protein A2275_00350 [Bacteroidetes bacterium RIFOXYA12_FULL_35_11]